MADNGYHRLFYSKSGYFFLYSSRRTSLRTMNNHYLYASKRYIPPITNQRPFECTRQPTFLPVSLPYIYPNRSDAGSACKDPPSQWFTSSSIIQRQQRPIYINNVHLRSAFPHVDTFNLAVRMFEPTLAISSFSPLQIVFA